jgi:hypothetical protein
MDDLLDMISFGVLIQMGDTVTFMGETARGWLKN